MKMKTTVQLACLKHIVLLTMLFALASTALTQTIQAGPASESVSLVLSADKRTIQVGEPLAISVSLRNEGTTDVFVRRDIYNGSDTLTLNLQHDGTAEGPRSRFAGDNFYKVKPSLASLLSRKWLVLGPGMCYGVTIVLHPTDYPRLLTPGRYLIYGQYKSGGFRDETRAYEQEAAELPFRVWEGTLKSKSISVEVTMPIRGEGRQGGRLARDSSE